MQAVKGSSMEKWLCWGSLVVSVIVLLCFVLDIILGKPFGGLSKGVDILGILAALLVGYLSYDALMDVI
jgi:hypothetical protein